MPKSVIPTSITAKLPIATPTIPSTAPTTARPQGNRPFRRSAGRPMPEGTAASRARVERAVSLAPAESIRYDALVQDDRVHASLYTDPRIFADEMERIFRRGWVFVGHESEIP